MPKNNCNKKMMAGLFAIMLSHGAQATIIDHGTYLTDTVSGMDWLDVTTSVNMSVNLVSSQFGVGGLFEGWRYASGDEFNQLVGNYTGNPVSVYSSVSQEPDLIDGLVIILGSTLDSYYLADFGKTYDQFEGYTEGTGLDYTLGILSDTYISGINTYWTAQLTDDDRRINSNDFSSAHGGLITNTNHVPFIGSYLVRDTNNTPIPEPSTFALLSLGLLAFAGSRNKHRL